jgi:hypothetical protein
VNDWEADLFGQRRVLLHGVDSTLVAQVLEEAGTPEVILLPLAHPAGELPCPSGPHTSSPIP